jgi:hypothetical protein
MPEAAEFIEDINGLADADVRGAKLVATVRL